MTIDATVAGATADSYLTVADADALAAARIGPDYDAWIAATDPNKERALVSATEAVDHYRSVPSVPYSTAQALIFPRETDLDADDEPVIVQRVRLATLEQAIYMLVNAELLADSAKRRARGLFSFSDDDGSGSQAVDPTWGLMAPKAVSYLSALGPSGTSGRATIVSVPLTSSFPTP